MIEIKRFEECHLSEVAALELECFTIPWSKEMFEEELKSNLAYYYVAVEEEKVIGYAGLWHILDEGQITNIAVTPSKRRKGVGQLLLEKLILTARELNISVLMLEVRRSNEGAKHLYSKNGFVQVGVRKGYYSDNNEDAILMNLEISEE